LVAIFSFTYSRCFSLLLSLSLPRSLSFIRSCCGHVFCVSLWATFAALHSHIILTFLSSRVLLIASRRKWRRGRRRATHMYRLLRRRFSWPFWQGRRRKRKKRERVASLCFCFWWWWWWRDCKILWLKMTVTLKWNAACCQCSFVVVVVVAVVISLCGQSSVCVSVFVCACIEWGLLSNYYCRPHFWVRNWSTICE